MSRGSGFKVIPRLLFTLFLAAGLHLLLLLGLPAGPVLDPPVSTTLQVHLTSTLAAEHSAEALAHQKKPLPSTPPTPDTRIKNRPPAPTIKSTPKPLSEPLPEPQPATQAPVVSQPVSAAKERQKQTDTHVSGTPQLQPSPIPEKTAQATKSPVVKPLPIKKPTPPKPSAPVKKSRPEPTKTPITATSTPKISASSLLARSLNMARATPMDELEPSRLGQRTRRLQGTRDNSAVENSYLMHWREKVQRIGALNYPESARRQKLSGQLRLLVVLRADGTLDEVTVISTSKSPELDQAAVRIVQLSAPFRPFPVAMQKTTDRLEIIRVWKFENDTVVY